MSETVRLNLKLSKEDHKELKMEAVRRDMTIQDLVKEAIQRLIRSRHDNKP